MLTSRRCGAVLSTACLIALAGCGGGSSSDANSTKSADSSKPVTLTWWHNATADPLKGFWQQVADDYHALHPNVSFTVVPVQNEQFNTKLPVALQSNQPPDIFQEWGGGQEATQVDAGKLMDLTQASSSWISGIGGQAAGWQVNGKQYGVPYSLGIVGFWYNKAMFAKAGITTPPATFDDLLADVTKLKAAGLTPIAIGSKDKWPDAFYWDYFALRECSKDTILKSAADYTFDDPCWVAAGKDTQRLLDAKPFQNGFLATPAQQGAGSSAGMLATGKAAMELQGHWDPGVMSGLTTSKEVLGSNLGWFPFPSVTGGAGLAGAQLGGGDGFACSYKAPPECADFLKYVTSVEVQRKFGALNVGLPVMAGSETSVSDANLQTLLKARSSTPYVQTYLDVQYVTSVGQALDDAAAQQFSGDATPEQVVKQIADAAKNR